MKSQLVSALLISVVVGLVAKAPAYGYSFGHETAAENETPKQLQDVGITEHLGETVNLDLKFRDENGQPVALRDYMKDGKPMLLSLAYFGCPSLCSFHLNGLNDAFRQLPAPLGQEFKFVVVSIEPKEKPELAGQKKAAYIKAYGRPEGAAGWHFLTGDEAQIHELAQQVGFKYHWDASENQWAHASAAYVLTPEGTISRYLYGIVFNPKDLRLSMIEASNGKVGTVVDKLILFCFHYDPKANKFTLAAVNMMKAGGVLILLVLGAYIAPFWFRKDDGLQGEA